MELDEFTAKVQELAIDLKANVCPIWQCGGILEHIDEYNGLNETNWQEPHLICKNCGAIFEFKGYKENGNKKE